jgi:hypothetical protein
VVLYIANSSYILHTAALFAAKTDKRNKNHTCNCSRKDLSAAYTITIKIKVLGQETGFNFTSYFKSFKLNNEMQKVMLY